MGGIVKAVLDPITGASETKAAAAQAADQQRAAAQQSAYASQFRPVGMTSAFGTSQFTREIDPTTGLPYVSSASYQAAPEISNLQSRLMSGYGGALGYAQNQQAQLNALSPAAQKLFGLADQYLATSPEQARADYMATQQAALAPVREQQLAQLRNQVFQTGRSGLGVGGTSTGMGQSNPEMQAYYNALAQQDLNLATQAEQAAQQRIGFGSGLFGQGAGLLGTQAQLGTAAYSPLQTLLGISGNVETMAQQPYQLGLGLGQAMLGGQTTGAQLYNTGMGQAAGTQYGGVQAGNAANASLISGLMQAGASAYGAKKV